MKKIISTFFLAAALLMALPAHAQFNFGLRGGLNLNDLKTSGRLASNLDKSNRAGFFVGPTVKFTIPVAGISLDASALYDNRSVKFSYAGESESLTSQNLTIPINVRYGFGLGSLANIFAYAGPQYAFNLSSNKEEWTWKKSTFSVNLGVGVTVLKHYEIRANYNIACGKTGESSNFEDALGNATDNISSKYNAWQIGIGYWF